MKKALVLFLSVIACVAGTVSCKKQVDYNYPTTFIFNNPTSHSIEVSIKSIYTPMDFSVAPGETYSKEWVIGFGPVPLELSEAEINFDGEHRVVHTGKEGSSYHNICDIDDYVRSDHPEIEHGRVLTFTFTEADYEYAVSAGGSGKDGN